MGSTSVKAPPPRNYAKEMQSALSAQAGIQGQLLGLEQYWQPKWQELQKTNLLNTLGTYNDFMTQANPMAAQQAAGFAQGFMPVMGQIAQGSRDSYMQMLGSQGQGLYNSMNQQAMQDMNAGWSLTDQQNTLAQQSARAAMAARGLTGNQAVGQEVLNSYAMAQQRQDRARAYANQVFGIDQGVASQGYQLLGAPLAGASMQFNPMNAFQGANALNGQVGDIFNPESKYNADLIGANQAMQMQANAANAANNAALWSGGMQMVGAIGGGYASRKPA